MWGNKNWLGEFFTKDAQAADFLSQYSSVFNAVEGNTTFYGLPSAATVQNWREQAADNFQFSFKFPQRISHGLQLKDARTETHQFFKTLYTLEERLGPFLLQLPAEFSVKSLDVLAKYLRSLPTEFKYLVEVRNLEFFHDAQADQALCDLLKTQNIDRVMFDTRPLFSDRASLDAVKDAQKKKPRVPANTYALNNHPTLRFIGHSQVQRSVEYFRPWWRKVANWIVEGREPHVFIHTPDNALAPQLAYLFHKGLQEFLPAMPDLPLSPAQLPQVQGALMMEPEKTTAKGTNQCQSGSSLEGPLTFGLSNEPQGETVEGTGEEVVDEKTPAFSEQELINIPSFSQLDAEPVEQDLSAEALLSAAPLLSRRAKRGAATKKTNGEDQLDLF